MDYFHYPYPFLKPNPTFQVREGISRFVHFWPTCLWRKEAKEEEGAWLHLPKDCCLKVSSGAFMASSQEILDSKVSWLWLEGALSEQTILLFSQFRGDRILLSKETFEAVYSRLSKEEFQKIAFVLELDRMGGDDDSPWEIHAKLKRESYAGFHINEPMASQKDLPLDVVALRRFYKLLRHDIPMPLSLSGGLAKHADAENLTRIVEPSMSVALGAPMSEEKWQALDFQNYMQKKRKELHLRQSP